MSDTNANSADNDITNTFSVEDAVDALTSRNQSDDDTGPSEDEDEDTGHTEEEYEDDDSGLSEDEYEDEDDDSAQDEDDEPVEQSDDDVVAEYSVDGETKKLTRAEAKRLAGQEAAITKRSKEVAARADYHETSIRENHAAAQAMYDRSTERLKEWESLDWLSLHHELPVEKFKALWAEFEREKADLQYFHEAVTKAGEQKHKFDEAKRMDTLKASAAKLTDPKTGLKGLNEKTYEAAMRHAVDNLRIPPDIVLNSVEDWAIEALYKAYLYDQGQNTKTTIVERKPKKIIKSTRNAEPVKQFRGSQSTQKAWKNLESIGDIDSAVDFLTARSRNRE